MLRNLYQVYTIYALGNNGRVLPYLVALLPSKNQHTYETFFKEISNLVPGIPQDILLDFERAAMNTLELKGDKCGDKRLSFILRQIFGNIPSLLDSRKGITKTKNLHFICQCWLP